jgi:gamma-glutamyl hydrolase
VLPEAFEKSPSLKAFFKITALSSDGAGKRFVSMVEANDYPFYGFQFHPEVQHLAVIETSI